MARNSKFSQKNYLAATSLGSTASKRGASLADQIMETKLRSEQAKLKLLEAELPDENEKKYTRYVDMPPPTPEDEAEFDRQFEQILSELFDGPEHGPEHGNEEGDEDGPEDGLEKGPEEGQTVQDWLIADGAVIPDSPGWKRPLYLDRYKPRLGVVPDKT